MTSGRPVLLRIDYHAGHVGLTKDQNDRILADVYSFLFWQLNGQGVLKHGALRLVDPESGEARQKQEKGAHGRYPRAP